MGGFFGGGGSSPSPPPPPPAPPPPPEPEPEPDEKGKKRRRAAVQSQVVNKPPASLGTDQQAAIARKSLLGQ